MSKPDRSQRLAEALRDNLKKRKAQQRARAPQKGGTPQASGDKTGRADEGKKPEGTER